MEIPVNSENSYVGDEMPCILGTQQDRVGGPLGPPRPCVLMGRIALPGMTQQKVHWHMGARLNEVKGEEQGSKQNKGFFLHLVQADMQWLKRCLLLPKPPSDFQFLPQQKKKKKKKHSHQLNSRGCCRPTSLFGLAPCRRPSALACNRLWNSVHAPTLWPTRHGAVTIQPCHPIARSRRRRGEGRFAPLLRCSPPAVHVRVPWSVWVEGNRHPWCRRPVGRAVLPRGSNSEESLRTLWSPSIHVVPRPMMKTDESSPPQGIRPFLRPYATSMGRCEGSAGADHL